MDLTVGIDEVGRGSWAGPVVAAAVMLTSPIYGLTDSKLLSRKRREELASYILDNSVYGVGWVHSDEVDKIGLTKSISKAMQNALDNIQDDYNQIIIDGNFNFLPENQFVKTEVKADLNYACVSAASILAKVQRDKYMAQQSLEYPNYNFELNVGYGTASHALALKKYGICEIHRKSFKPILALL